jgi:hypothetical protein
MKDGADKVAEEGGWKRKQFTEADAPYLRLMSEMNAILLAVQTTTANGGVFGVPFASVMLGSDEAHTNEVMGYLLQLELVEVDGMQRVTLTDHAKIYVARHLSMTWDAIVRVKGTLVTMQF